MEINLDQKVEVEIELCVNCLNCKTRNGIIYCKEGFFKIKKGTPITYTPYEFDCFSYEEV